MNAHHTSFSLAQFLLTGQPLFKLPDPLLTESTTTLQVLPCSIDEIVPGCASNSDQRAWTAGRASLLIHLPGCHTGISFFVGHDVTKRLDSNWVACSVSDSPAAGVQCVCVCMSVCVHAGCARTGVLGVRVPACACGLGVHMHECACVCMPRDCWKAGGRSYLHSVNQLCTSPSRVSVRYTHEVCQVGTWHSGLIF